MREHLTKYYFCTDPECAWESKSYTQSIIHEEVMEHKIKWVMFELPPETIVGRV